MSIEILFRDGRYAGHIDHPAVTVPPLEWCPECGETDCPNWTRPRAVWVPRGGDVAYRPDGAS